MQDETALSWQRDVGDLLAGRGAAPGNRRGTQALSGACPPKMLCGAKTDPSRVARLVTRCMRALRQRVPKPQVGEVP